MMEFRYTPVSEITRLNKFSQIHWTYFLTRLQENIENYYMLLYCSYSNMLQHQLSSSFNQLAVTS